MDTRKKRILQTPLNLRFLPRHSFTNTSTRTNENRTKMLRKRSDDMGKTPRLGKKEKGRTSNAVREAVTEKAAHKSS